LADPHMTKIGCRNGSSSANNDDGGGGKDKTPQEKEFTEEDWEKIMGLAKHPHKYKYVRRPSAIHDYKDDDVYKHRGIPRDDWTVADQENLLTELRLYKAGPIGPWSWTPIEEIRNPKEAVRQHGPTCSCELCRRAPETFWDGKYLTKCELMEKPGKKFVFDSEPESGAGTKFVVSQKPDSKIAKRQNIWEEDLPSPPWLDDSYHPKYAREIRLLYNQDHPWLKGRTKRTTQENQNAMAEPKPTGVTAAEAEAAVKGNRGGNANDSPRWLDSSYHPAYAEEIRRLYQSQNAQKKKKKAGKNVWDNWKLGEP